LRRAQPRGPYCLGGWSSGASIAFEIAAQLETAGEIVGQMFLLDGPCPTVYPDVSEGKLLRWFLEDLALGLPVERLRGLSLDGLSPEGQLRAAAPLLGVATRTDFNVRQLALNYEVFADIILAVSRYRPARVSCDLTVVRVENDVVEEFASHPDRDKADWGWSPFTRGRVHCARAPGTHHSFLSEPAMGQWISLLDAIRER
jgi:thioesterase domain-containing protein